VSVQLVSKISNLCGCDPPTSQTDGRTTCNRNTALCTENLKKSKNLVFTALDWSEWQQQWCLRWAFTVLACRLHWLLKQKKRYRDFYVVTFVFRDRRWFLWIAGFTTRPSSRTCVTGICIGFRQTRPALCQMWNPLYSYWPRNARKWKQLLYVLAIENRFTLNFISRSYCYTLHSMIGYSLNPVVRPSVCLSVCDAVHSVSQGWCARLKVVPACFQRACSYLSLQSLLL